MPTDLLEKPVEVEETAREVLKAKSAVINVPVSDREATARQEVKSLWRRVFEGREEYLGWTPD